MPGGLKLAACMNAALACGFLWFFQVTKHDPQFALGNPFAEDPYDTVASFAAQLVLFTSVVGLLRAFRTHRPALQRQPPTHGVASAILATSMAVLIALAVDMVCLLRHRMAAIPGTKTTLFSLTLYALLATATALIWQVLFLRRFEALRRVRWDRVGYAIAVLVIVFAFYPEQIRRSIPGELFTVVVGIWLYFAALAVFLNAVLSSAELTGVSLVRDLAEVARSLKLTGLASLLERTLLPPKRTKLPAWLRPMAVILLTGVAAGLFLFVQEVRGDVGVGAAKHLFVAAIYMGIETTGLLAGYVLLNRPLALFPRG